MDTPTLIRSDLTRRIFIHQALSKQKIKRGPGENPRVRGLNVAPEGSAGEKSG